MVSPIRVGLVGYGLSGRMFHAPFIVAATERLRLTHVVERHGEESRKSHPDVTVVRDLEELLGRDGPELIVIATPNASHFSLADRALRAGKHIVVDKPFTTTSAEARRLVELAEGTGRVLSVYQNRRWDGDFRTIQRVVADGLCGRLVRYDAHFDRFRPTVKQESWKERAEPGSGVLYDLGSHLIDQAIVLFGLPATVTADIRVEREQSETDDSFDVTLGYEARGLPRNGLRVRLRASRLVREPGPRYMLHGTRGSFVKSGVDPQEEALLAGRSPSDREAWGIEPQDRWGLLHTEIDGVEVVRRVETLPGCYQAFYVDVCDAILEGRTPAVTGRDGYRIVRTIELAMESASSGRTIPWSEHHELPGRAPEPTPP